MHIFLTFFSFALVVKGLPANSLSPNAVYNQTVNGILGITISNDKFGITGCDGHQTTLLKKAVLDARNEALSAFAACGTPEAGGHGSEAYTAMFKSNKYVHLMEDVFEVMTKAKPAYRSEAIPEIRCLLPNDPHYTMCRQKITIVSRVSLNTAVIEVCPAAFELPATAVYDPRRCPTVKPGSETFWPRKRGIKPFEVMSLSEEIRDALLWQYIPFQSKFVKYTWSIEIEDVNLAHLASIDQSSEDWRNYLVYIKLLLYKCTEFPNVKLPSSNYNQTVNEILGRATSNAEFDITNCGDSETNTLKKAIRSAQLESVRAFTDCGVPGFDSHGGSIGSKAYQSMFKSDQYKDHPIRDVFQGVWLAEPTKNTKVIPSIRCLLPNDPDYNLCEGYSGPIISRVTAGINRVEVCPQAFRIREVPDYDPIRCPIVRPGEHVFAPRGRGTAPFRTVTLNEEIRDMLLWQYIPHDEPFDKYYPGLAGIYHINNALRRSIDDSPKNGFNYLTYVRLLLYKCTEFPNVDLPPYNFPALEEEGNTTFVLSPSPSNSSSSSPALPSSLSVE